MRVHLNWKDASIWNVLLLILIILCANNFTMHNAPFAKSYWIIKRQYLPKKSVAINMSRIGDNLIKRFIMVFYSFVYISLTNSQIMCYQSLKAYKVTLRCYRKWRAAVGWLIDDGKGNFRKMNKLIFLRFFNSGFFFIINWNFHDNHSTNYKSCVCLNMWYSAK